MFCVGSPKSPDANLSFIEIESRLREKIRVNAAELRQVRSWFQQRHPSDFVFLPLIQISCLQADSSNYLKDNLLIGCFVKLL